MWGTDEIGQELGVTPRRAREISRTYSDFPIPEIERKGLRLWRADLVVTWADRHGSRTSGRPKKVPRENREALASVLRSWMDGRGATAAFVADRVKLPARYVEDLLDSRTDHVAWPSASTLRELSALFDKNPALALDAAGYSVEARRERANFGRNNESTRALAEELKRLRRTSTP